MATTTAASSWPPAPAAPPSLRPPSIPPPLPDPIAALPSPPSAFESMARLAVAAAVLLPLRVVAAVLVLLAYYRRPRPCRRRGRAPPAPPRPRRSPAPLVAVMEARELSGGHKTAATHEEAPPLAVVLVSAGASHSVALLAGNVLCTWGRGEDGQLGHRDAEDRLVPTVISGFDAPGITSVICGSDHTTAYSEEEQQVYSWGWGDFGRLGHGNSSDVFTPQPVKALQRIQIKQLACGDSHCLTVTMAGEVQSWGRNQNGQLGLGTTEDSLLPQKIQAFERKHWHGATKGLRERRH